MRREESVELPLKGLYLEIWKDRRLEKEKGGSGWRVEEKEVERAPGCYLNGPAAGGSERAGW